MDRRLEVGYLPSIFMAPSLSASHPWGTELWSSTSRLWSTELKNLIFKPHILNSFLPSSKPPKPKQPTERPLLLSRQPANRGVKRKRSRTQSANENVRGLENEKPLNAKEVLQSAFYPWCRQKICLGRLVLWRMVRCWSSI